ncbi:hypothetical protein [Kutzneria buriramensis]|nr:hypothetical protein [Kutzneria buriramensis]
MDALQQRASQLASHAGNLISQWQALATALAELHEQVPTLTLIGLRYLDDTGETSYLDPVVGGASPSRITQWLGLAQADVDAIVAGYQRTHVSAMRRTAAALREWHTTAAAVADEPLS